MGLRALVEAVDLELEPVVSELEQELLELARRPVRDAPAAKGRVDREAAEIRDPAAPVGDLEAHHAGRAPFAVVEHLDHEAAVLLRLGLRALDLGEQLVAAARADDR